MRREGSVGPESSGPTVPERAPRSTGPRRGGGFARVRAASVGLIRAAHAGPTAAVTVLITALAAAVGHGVGGCALVGLAVLTGQLSVGWSNDRVDAARDLANHRWDKPIVAGAVSARLVAVAAGVAVVACVPLSLANGVVAGGVHLGGVAAAWGYNLGLKRTPLSFVPYAVGFAVLPAFAVLSLPGTPAPPLWLLAAGAGLGVAGHLTNVIPDIPGDLATGVRGLPHRLGATASLFVALLLLVAASATAVLGPPGAPDALDWAGLAVAVVLAVGGSVARSGRLPFLATIGVAAIDVALLLRNAAAIS